jgi:hypothetical protein
MTTNAVIKADDKLDFSVTLFGSEVKWWREITQAVVATFEKKAMVFNASFRLERAESVFDSVIIHDGKANTNEPRPAVWIDEVKQHDGECLVNCVNG